MALLAGTVASAGTALVGAPDKPPPVAKPAAPAPTTREANPDVRIGSGSATDDDTAPEYEGFTERRTFGRSLGGLGRGGLGL